MHKFILVSWTVFLGLAIAIQKSDDPSTVGGNSSAGPSKSSEVHQQVLLSDAPEVSSVGDVARLTLHAVSDSAGHDAFQFQGQTIPPVIRVSPGDRLDITYINDLPLTPTESCAVPPCHNMTNLHFHGLTVSPLAPQDDVLNMMAMPGQVLHYSVQIPPEHPPGLYWYHTHPHGESHRQVLDGMSGAIVIEGMESYVPEIRNLRERVLVLRAQEIERGAASLGRQVDLDRGCRVGQEPLERMFTVNGIIRPKIDIAPGERQFWRIVNASADQYADIQVDGSVLEIVALDGMPIAYHEPNRSTIPADHVLLPPAGRLEAIISAPLQPGVKTVLRTRCVDTGPDGDPNPGMVLADVVPDAHSLATPRSSQVHGPQPLHKRAAVAGLENTAPQFVVDFTEDKNGFYINGRKYDLNTEPMVHVRVGSYQHWRIMNNTRELHPMHIHQVHFLAYSQNGVTLPTPAWLDTVNVPAGGFVDVIMDFTDPVIRGVSVFHCHLLNHEDKGMMAKILFE